MEFEIGKTYEFKAHSRFKHPLQGIVQKVYDNSILVKITVVHREDKENISDSNNQMIISKKYVLNQIKTKKLEENKRMKFNINTASLLLPGTFGAEGKECITISKSGLALSGPVVRRLNKPKWVQLYLDESRLALVVIPCEATDEGARSCVNPKSKKKAGYRKNWSGSILEKVAKASKMDIENHRYHVEPEEVEGYPKALGFDLTKAVKING